MKPRWLCPVLLALLALLVLRALPAQAAETALLEPKPPAVTVVAATQGEIAETALLTGTLVPREEVLVSPQIDGFAITEILAEEGDTVAPDQVLARLSRDVIEANLAQNTAQLSRAQASIAQAQSAVAEAHAQRTQSDLALARTRDLLSGGNASHELFEQRQASADSSAARQDAAVNALGAAEADRALAEAQRRELLVRLARTEIRAPVGGKISRRTARQGAVVGMAGEPLFRIIANGEIELDADVPETLLAKLRAGQQATIAGAGATRAGHVRLVSPEVSRTTRLGRVRVQVDDTAALAIGSFARATVELARHGGVLAPLSAVLFQPDGPVVQVVHDGVVETRPVSVGLRTPQQVEITAGLRPGEELVAVSGTFVRGGDRVTSVVAK